MVPSCRLEIRNVCPMGRITRSSGPCAAQALMVMNGIGRHGAIGKVSVEVFDTIAGGSETEDRRPKQEPFGRHLYGHGVP